MGRGRGVASQLRAKRECMNMECAALRHERHDKLDGWVSYVLQDVVLRTVSTRRKVFLVIILRIVGCEALKEQR